MSKLSHVICYVNDLMNALAFYEKVFSFKPKFIYEEKTYAELETGMTTLAFADISLADFNIPTDYTKHSQSKPPALTELVIKVDNVEDYFQKALQEGAKKIADPIKKPWGETIGYVQDPQGILIAICSSNLS